MGRLVRGGWAAGHAFPWCQVQSPPTRGEQTPWRYLEEMTEEVWTLPGLAVQLTDRWNCIGLCLNS